MTQNISYTLDDLACHLDAQLIGHPDTVITGLADLASAGEGDVSFLSSAKYASALASTQASAVVLHADQAEGFSGNALVLADPYVAYAKLSALFETRLARAPGIHTSADIHPTAVIGDGVAISAHCSIGEGAVIGDNVELYPGVCIGERAQIGQQTIIFPNTVVYHDVIIGERCRIHANTTIGSDGFGFAPTAEGWKKIHQIGSVIVGNDVEIGANTAIDRGALGNTRIADGVIIDNQVHIAHNVQVGERTAIAGCVGIAGSTTIGKDCQFAGMVALAGHVNVADKTVFLGGTIATKGNKEAGVFASASPLQEASKWRKNTVRMRQLDDAFARIKSLEKQLEKLVRD